MIKNKKIFLFVGLILLVGLLGWFVKNLMVQDGKSMTELIDFAIEDTSKIDKIKILEPNGIEFELNRTADGWVDKNGGCVIQENIKLILETAKNMEFKGYVPENSRKQFIKLMAAQSMKVEYFENGEYSKTWYIGPSTQDHYGQVMLLETADAGKSDLPVLMKVKRFNGIIEPRFYADPRKWQCTNIMGFSIDEIKKVEFKNLEDPAKSFSIKHSGFQFEVRQNGKMLPSIDTTKVFRYLQNFKKVNFEMPNYVLSEKQIDSLKSTKPFATLKVENTKSKPVLLKCFRIEGEPIYDSEVATFINYDMNRFWCLLPNGEFVKCQYFVFDPIFRGDVYFPFDKSNYKNKTALE